MPFVKETILSLLYILAPFVVNWLYVWDYFWALHSVPVICVFIFMPLLFLCVWLLWFWGFPGVSDSKESACNAGDPCSIPGKILWRRAWKLTLVFCPGEFHGQRSLVRYSPWSRKETDTAERLTRWSTCRLDTGNFGQPSLNDKYKGKKNHTT